MKVKMWIFLSPPAPESIWSSIWSLIEEGYLKHVGSVRYERRP